MLHKTKLKVYMCVCVCVCVYILYTHTTHQEINTFIHQGCIILIKSVSKEFYIV